MTNAIGAAKVEPFIITIRASEKVFSFDVIPAKFGAQMTVFLVQKSYDIDGYYSAFEVDKIFARREDAEAYAGHQNQLIAARQHLLNIERKYDQENPFVFNEDPPPDLPSWNKDNNRKREEYNSRLRPAYKAYGSRRTEEISKIWQSENQPFSIEEISDAGWEHGEFIIQEMKVE